MSTEGLWENRDKAIVNFGDTIILNGIPLVVGALETECLKGMPKKRVLHLYEVNDGPDD